MSPQLPMAASLYKPLSNSRNEIRLLTLHPGIRSDLIRCSLTTHSIDDVPIYRALSYEWSSPKALKEIEVDGSLIQIRPNLHEFLLELRDVHASRVLWADAICINQKDIDERSHQVTLMARIFTGAEEVMAWLGPAADRSDEVLDLVASFPSGDQDLSGDEESENRSFNQNDFFLALCDRRLSLAFCHLLNRSYWSRLWMLQEIVLAKVVKICCGSRIANLDPCSRYGSKIYERRENATIRSNIYGFLTDCQSPVLDEIPADKSLVLFAELNGIESVYTEVTQRERPFPAFVCKTGWNLNFTFSRPACSRLWEIETLRISTQDYTIDTRPTGFLSFEESDGLLLENVNPENVREIAHEVVNFYYGSFTYKAKKIIEQRYRNGLRSSFAGLCSTIQHLQCEDVRDRIFGVLGLINNPNIFQDYGEPSTSVFMPNYSWAPAEVLFQILKHFRLHSGTVDSSSIAKCLGLFSDQHTDRFIEYQETMSFSERIRYTLIFPAWPEPLLNSGIYERLAGLNNLYWLHPPKHKTFDPCCGFFLYLLSEEVKEEHLCFEFDHIIFLFATPKKGSDSAYQCIGIALLCEASDMLEKAKFYAPYMEEISEYLPAITINKHKVPSYWGRDDVAVEMPFLCFFNLLTREIIPESKMSVLNCW